MDVTMPPAGTGWTITNQRPVVVPGAGGALTQAMEVTFTTGHGITGQINIEMARYNVENVRAAVSAQATILDQVSALKG